MKKWKCSVCGYIHEGNEPPDTCPVCGADKSKFIELVEEKPQAEPKQIEAIGKIPPVVVTQILKHHVHPISVHIPNGVVPVSFIFVVLAVIFNFKELSQAAFYNLIFVILAMPLVLFSGYVEWKQKYGGNLTTVFLIKIICGAVVSLSALILIIWYIANPEVAASHSTSRLGYLFLNLIMLGAATIAGFFGGKLVFKD